MSWIPNNIMLRIDCAQNAWLTVCHMQGVVGICGCIDIPTKIYIVLKKMSLKFNTIKKYIVHLSFNSTKDIPCRFIILIAKFEENVVENIKNNIM